MNDPVIVINGLLIVYAVLVTGWCCGEICMRRAIVAECRRILREADAAHPHGDVPQLPAGWPGKRRAA